MVDIFKIIKAVYGNMLLITIIELPNRREREQGRKQGSKGINVIQVDLGLQADRRHFLVHSNTDCIHVMHMGERLQIFSKTDGQTN